MRLCQIICLTWRPQFPLPPSKHTLIWKVCWESKCKIEIFRLTSLRCARRLFSSHFRLSSVAYLPPSCQGGAPKIGSRLAPQSPLINVELCSRYAIMKASKSLGFEPLFFFFPRPPLSFSVFQEATRSGSSHPFCDTKTWVVTWMTSSTDSRNRTNT